MLVFWTAKLGRQSLRFYSTAASPQPRTIRRLVETLDPSKIEEKGQKPIYLSTAKICSPLLHVRCGDPSERSTAKLFLRYRYSKDNVVAGFPSQSLGYLYYRPADPNRPATSAEIRFRMAAAADRFSIGEDLKMPDGEPWRRPLFTLNANASKPLYDKLIEEGLISQDVERSLQALFSSKEFGPFLSAYHQGSTILYALSDPFTLDLSVSRQTLIALTDSGCDQAGWLYPFGDMRSSRPPRRMYKGTIRLCFEPSTLPEHAGTRTVVLRVVDVIHPVECVDPEYDGWVRKPEVGELVLKPGLHGPSPLSFNLDVPKPSKMAMGRLTDVLRLLWKNDSSLAPVTGATSAKPLPTVTQPSSTFSVEGRTRVIKTLDPSKFRQTGQTLFDISGEPSLHLEGPNIHQRLKLPLYHGEKQRDFPVKTTGYLYFQPAGAKRPHISGTLRFRLAATPEEFATSEDLKRPDGKVWQAPVYVLAKHPSSKPLFDKIMEEGLIPQDLHTSINTLLSDKGKAALPPLGNDGVLYSLSDPFKLDLSFRSQTLWAVTDNGCLPASWQSPILEMSGGKFIRPYKGLIRVRFERSKLRQHTRTRTIVVRVLEILEPIQPTDPDYDGPTPVPEVGELLLRKSQYGYLEAVSFDLDFDQRQGSSFLAFLSRLWESDVECRTLRK